MSDQPNHETFVRAVAEMRRCQRQYFKTRDPRALDQSKEAERKVDKLVSQFFDKQRTFDFC